VSGAGGRNDVVVVLLKFHLMRMLIFGQGKFRIQIMTQGGCGLYYGF